MGLLSSVAATCKETAGLASMALACLASTVHKVFDLVGLKGLRQSQWLGKVHHLHDGAATSGWDIQVFLIVG